MGGGGEAAREEEEGEGSTKIPGLREGGLHQEPCVPSGWVSS